MALWVGKVCARYQERRKAQRRLRERGIRKRKGVVEEQKE
jgi:hypothetical protein